MQRMRQFLCFALVLTQLNAGGWACSYSAPLWIPNSFASSPLYKFMVGKEKDSKSGYIDQTGKVVIQPTLSLQPIFVSSEFRDGMLKVSHGKYWDVSGRVAIDIAVEQSAEFSEGLAAAKVRVKEIGLWGFIDRSGKFAIQPKFNAMPQPFSDGLSLVVVGDRVGYINKSGEFAIEPKFMAGRPFFEGRALVIVEGPCALEFHSDCFSSITFPQPARELSNPNYRKCKYAFIDTHGSVISSDRYDEALNFSEGLAAVRVGKMWGYVDQSGRMAIPLMFYDAESFSEGLAVIGEPFPISRYTGKRGWSPGDPKPPEWRYGFINARGAVVIEPQFASAKPFHDGVAVASDSFLVRGTNHYYIGQDGKRAFPGNFNDASSFFRGLAHVRLSNGYRQAWYELGAYAYIDRAGRIVFSYDPEVFQPTPQ